MLVWVLLLALPAPILTGPSDHPFVILDPAAVGTTFSAAAPLVAASSPPTCCGTNYSIALDPAGRLLAVAVDNLLCPDHLALLRHEILQFDSGGRTPHAWETMADAKLRLESVRWLGIDAVFDPMQPSAPPPYDGQFPGITKTLPAHLTSGVRECLGFSLPEDVFEMFLDPKNSLTLNRTALEGRPDLMRMPVHANDTQSQRNLNNVLLPRYGSFAGSIALPPGQVLPTQSAPHSDGFDGLASVLTLTEDTKYQRSGTALMRQKTSGISRVDTEAIRFEVSREDRYKMRSALQDPLDSLDSGYLNRSCNRYAESILRVNNKVNRIVLYPQAHLHNAFLPDEALLSAEPAKGRLTMNMFWALSTSGHDQVDGREHAWFCAGMKSSEAICNAWRDCKWCPASHRCIPSFNSAVLSSSSALPPVDVCPPARRLVNARRTVQAAALEGVNGAFAAEANHTSTDAMDNDGKKPSSATKEVLASATTSMTKQAATSQIPLLLNLLRERLVNVMRSVLSDVPNQQRTAASLKDIMEWNNYRVKRGLGHVAPSRIFLQEAVDVITPSVLRNIYDMATKGGADIHSVTALGQNALHFSAAIGASALANFLVAAGVDPFAKDALGRTPAMIAASQGYVFDPKLRPTLTRSATKPALFRSHHQDGGESRDVAGDFAGDGISRGNGGGWDESVYAGKGVSWPSDDDEQCDIYSVQASVFTPVQFLNHVVRRGQPVLIRRALIDDHDGPWRALFEWTRPNLGAVLGEYYEKDVDAVPYIFEKSNEGKETRHFKEHLEQTEAWPCASTENHPSPYWFQSWDNKGTRQQSRVHHRSERFLQDDIKIPAIIRKLVAWNSSYEYNALNHDFYHGVCGAGAPMHTHVAAWNALVFGKKMWSIHAPSRTIARLDSPRAQAAEFSQVRLEDAPYRCVQNAGDVLIVPYMWSHSVLNLKESVGVAVQFKLGIKVASPRSNPSGHCRDGGDTDGVCQDRQGDDEYDESVEEDRIEVY